MLWIPHPGLCFSAREKQSRRGAIFFPEQNKERLNSLLTRSLSSLSVPVSKDRPSMRDHIRPCQASILELFFLSYDSKRGIPTYHHSSWPSWSVVSVSGTPRPIHRIRQCIENVMRLPFHGSCSTCHHPRRSWRRTRPARTHRTSQRYPSATTTYPSLAVTGHWRCWIDAAVVVTLRIQILPASWTTLGQSWRHLWPQRPWPRKRWWSGKSSWCVLLLLLLLLLLWPSKNTSLDVLYCWPGSCSLLVTVRAGVRDQPPYCVRSRARHTSSPLFRFLFFYRCFVVIEVAGTENFVKLASS